MHSSLESAIKSINSMHCSRWYKDYGNGQCHAYHYIVHTDWSWEKLRPLDQQTPATSNQDVNRDGIHIVMNGNMNITAPTNQQYDSIRYLVKELRNNYWYLPISGHKDHKSDYDWTHSECPWDLTELDKFEPITEVVTSKKTTTPTKVSASNNWDTLLTDEVQIIGCYNSNTNLTSPVNSNGNCLKGGQWWRKNIMLPPKNHIPIWKEFYTDREIVNRLAIVNFESSFTTHRSNQFAHWYVQTLRKWNISPEVRPQLEWMYKRERVILLERTSWWSARCWLYWNEPNTKDWFPAWEDGVLACMYRYHYHSSKGTRYAKRWLKVRDYYLNWFRDKWFNL